MNKSALHKLGVLTAATLFGLAVSTGASATEQTKPLADTATNPAVVDTAPNTSVSIDPRFTVLDKDGDGSLLQSDVPASHDLGTDLFAAFDTDKDQRLSSAEFAVYAGSNDAAVEEEEEEEEEAE